MEFLLQSHSMAYFAKYAAIAFIAIHAFCYYFKPRKSTRKTMPSAPWIPFLGSLPFMGRYPEKTITKWGREGGYGSVFQVRFGTKKMIILNDYESIKEGFVRNGHRISGRIQTSLIKEMTKGNGLIFLDYGDKWRSQRKFGHQAFRKIAVNEKINAIVAEEAQMLVSAIEMQLSNKNPDQEYLCSNYRRVPTSSEFDVMDVNNNEGQWQTLDPKIFIHKALGNVVCNLLFGRSFTKDEKEYNAVLEETPVQARKSFAMFMLVFLAPSLRNVPYIKSVLDEALCLRKATFKMIRELVDGHIAAFTEIDETSDFVECFLAEMKTDESDPSHFNYDQLLTFVFDLFTAGSESTADTILWALLYLARNPTLQSKIRDEVLTIAREDDLPSVRHMSKMHLTRATIHETLRIRPISTLGVAHTASREAEVKGFHIPKNSVVLPNMWSVQHNPEVFPNPDEFDAMRHISETGEFVPSSHVIAFSMGPRQCIGKKIAEIDMFLILTAILKHFEFQLPKKWNADKSEFATVEPDMNGTSGHVLLPPDYTLEWRKI